MKSRGFTLIELLVVISIISLLSSVVLASVNNARKKAANADRNLTAHAYHEAFELYFHEYGYYPDPGPGGQTLYCFGNQPSPTCFSGTVPFNPAIDTAITQFMGSLKPIAPFQPPSSGVYHGPLYQCLLGAGTGKCTSAILSWYLDRISSPSIKCTDSAIQTQIGGSYRCAINLP